MLKCISQPSAVYRRHAGSDQEIVAIARASFADFDVKEISDAEVIRLCGYLARGMSSSDYKEEILKIMDGVATIEEAVAMYNSIRNRSTHWTPFAHTQLVFQCKAPIPLRTQAFKHKQGLVENEESRRYITTEPEIYLPDFRCKPEGSIKQGSGEIHFANEVIQKHYEQVCRVAVKTYNAFIDMGVCPEQARLVLPQGAVVNWVWTGNLYAFFNYCVTRLDSHAQKDAYPMAHDIAEACSKAFPLAWAALMNQSI